MITYYEKPFAVVCWNEELKVAELTWKGFTTSQDFRETLNKALELVKTKKAARFLSDSLKLKLIMPEDQAWLNETWTPALLKCGVKKLASLVPESAVARLAIDKLTRDSANDQSNLGYEVSFFQTLEQARKWIVN